MDFEVIAEPGRHFASFSGYLLIKVIGTKINKYSDHSYHVNDSVYHSFKPAAFQNNIYSNVLPQFYSRIDSETKKSSEIK